MAMNAERLRGVLVLLGLVQCASCLLSGEGGVCSTQLVTTQAGDSSFAGYPAGASVGATISATGNLSYSGASASLLASSKISLQIAWDQSSVSAPYVTCPDHGSWLGTYQIPVRAKLTTTDGLFSETLTGTVDKTDPSGDDQMVHFNDLALSDLQGTFSWRDVSAWSTESDVCAGATLRFGMLLQNASTKAITLRDRLPGFINVECPSDTAAPIVFSALPTFN